MDHVRNFQFAMIARRLQASPIIRKESVLKVAASLANWNPPVDLVRLPDTRFPRSRVVSTFHPLQNIDATAPGYDVAGILKTGALNRYYRRTATVDSSYHGPERREHFTPPTGNGKLAPDAFDNLDSLEF